MTRNSVAAKTAKIHIAGTLVGRVQRCVRCHTRMDSNDRCMNIHQIVSIFGRTIDSLQLCQCVRDIECSGYFSHKPLERVILHAICGGRVPGESLNHSYGDVRLNDLLDASLARESMLMDREFTPGEARAIKAEIEREDENGR